MVSSAYGFLVGVINPTLMSHSYRGELTGGDQVTTNMSVETRGLGVAEIR